MKYQYYKSQDNRVYRVFSPPGYRGLRMQQYKFDSNTREYKWCRKYSFKAIRDEQGVILRVYADDCMEGINLILNDVSELEARRCMMLQELAR